MLRRFNEGQRHWRDDLSQIARILLPLSFDVFVGLLIGIIALQCGLIYLLLYVVYFCYLEHKYYFSTCFIITVTLLCLLGVQFIPNHFKEEICGEVKNVYYHGIQIKDYFIYCDSSLYEIGDEVKCQLEQRDYFQSGMDGSFDEALYYQSKGITYVTYGKEMEVVDHHFHLRPWILEMVKKNTHEHLQGIYLYLLLGDKIDAIDEVNEMAQNMAILHIFAISGMHFTLLGEWLKKLLTLFMSEKVASYFILAIMTLYAVCLEGNVAAWRAYLMMLLKEVGVKDLESRFGLVGIFFLTRNPGLIFHMGFVYSMTLYFLVIMTASLKFSDVYVYLGSMVLSTFFQYEIMPLGFLFGILFNLVITSLFPLFVFDVLTQGMISFLCIYLYDGMVYLMELVNQFRFEIIIGKPPLLLMMMFYVSYVYAIYQFSIYHKKHYFLIPLLAFSGILIAPYCDRYGKVTMLDVGQGDCFLISFPHQAEHLLIDTGGLSYLDVAKEKLIPYFKYHGIKKIDTIYISHQDFDHCGSLESLKANFKVDEVVEDFKVASHQGVSFLQLNQKIYDNENDNSLIIQVQLGGLDYLFTGDISMEVEEDLLDVFSDLDVLKVAHHGSSTSTSFAFLEKTTPILSLISVGKNNRYGHPTKDVLHRLAAYGSKIYRSDEDGCVTIYFKDEHSYLEKNGKND